jgi:hypothetical protein
MTSIRRSCNYLDTHRDGEIAIMPPALAAQASSPDGRAAARASSPEGPRGRGLARAEGAPAEHVQWPGRPADALGGIGLDRWTQPTTLAHAGEQHLRAGRGCRA